MIIACIIYLLTMTCTDDVLRWSNEVAPVGTVNIRVEAYSTFTTYGATENVLAWEKTKQAGARSEPVGCEDTDLMICVFPIDSAGVPLMDIECFSWKAGGGRMLDDSNISGGWTIPPMCGE